MRIALILLSILALVFIGSISWSLIGQDGSLGFKKISTSSSPSGDSLVIETWKNQIKTDEKIEKLSTMVAELAQKNGVQPTTTETGSTGSGSESVRVSGKLLSLLMPTATLVETSGKGIFDLHIFDASTNYTFYEDAKLGLKLIATSMSYDTFLKNAKAIDDSVYSVNEVSTFPFRSFYLNPPKADTLVRLVVEMEGQAIGIEVPKTKFPTIKNLLLSRDSTPVAPKPAVKTSKTVTPVLVSQPKASSGSTASGTIKK